MLRYSPRILLRMAVWVCLLGGCVPLDKWNQQLPPSSDPDGCPPYKHNLRGPDAYDVAHGRPYHCEAPGPDIDNADVDHLGLGQ